MSTKRDEEVMDESAMDFTMDELREFLEADLLDVPADPEFKERLRKKLWTMLEARRARGPGSTEH
jgi:hypothetical protein